MSLPNEVNLHHLGSTGYNIARSVRLRNTASGYFSRTPASASNRTTWTWSGWVKRGSAAFGTNGVGGSIFGGGSIATANQPNFKAQFYGDTIYLLETIQNVSGQLLWESTPVYRDPSNWYHIVVAIDTTQATSTNRIKVYVNGLQISGTFTITPSQNQATSINNNVPQYQGADPNNSQALFYMDGYLTEINFIDGQQLTPSSFGSTNAITGVWQPAKYTGTYGTNGFYLNFSDNSNNTAATIGKDYSGNGNNWTPNNISVTAGSTYDSMTDVPTLTSATAANYAVFNPLAKGSAVTISDGNLKYSVNAASGTNGFISMYISSGMKSYFEFTCGAAALYRNVDFGSAGVTYTGDGGVISGGTGGSGTFATWTTNDVIAFACDYSVGTIACYKNNTLQTTVTGVTNTSPWSINAGQAVGLGEFYFNAGQRPFTYTPPAGFVGLNTFNISDSTVKKGNKNFDILTWSGTGGSAGATRSLTGLNFQPDFVWEKNRTSTQDHHIFDAVRGAGLSKTIASNSSGAEGAFNDTTFGYLSSFDSGGVTTTNGSSTWDNWNKSGDTFVAWSWNAGGSTVTNTTGTISAQVRANPTAGFSVVTYTGPGSGGGTVGHGLGVAPNMIIIKNRSATEGWRVGHSYMNSGSSPWNYYMNLNGTAAQVLESAIWNNTTPTSTVFTIANDTSVSGSGNSIVAYCFAAVAGYSAFGSFTGNGSADGPFVYTGFRPAFVMAKLSSTTGDWNMVDDMRQTYNDASGNPVIRANLGNVEEDVDTMQGQMDILSNGFKLRSNNSSLNANGGTIIYAAFAKNPFKNALAR